MTRADRGHVSDELPLLLVGEADRATVLHAAEHLRTCVDCQHELVSAVVAHASLTSAQRFAPEVISSRYVVPPDPGDAEAAEPAGAAAGSADVIALPTDADRAPAQASAPSRPASAPARPLPDMSELFAAARRDASERQERPASSGPSRRRYVVAAAAAAVVIGGGVGAYVGVAGGGSSAQTIALSAYDRGTTGAVAHLGSNGALSINASSLPRLTGKRYEIWLTNSARTAMQPVGWIDNDGTASVQVPTALVQRFSDIEVSVQSLHGPYPYSGVSVLRGAYRSS